MKCYVGGSTEPSEFNFVTACFAESGKKAKKMMWNQGELSEDCDYEYIFARVVRAPEHDHLFGKDGCTDAHIIRNEWILREMGWMIYGDQRCSGCEMAEYEGKWPLCEHCEQCTECGHDDGCESGADQAGGGS